MNRQPFDVLILGGSIAALKCASILTSLLGKNSRIGLVSANQTFLFLPLTPDVISGRVPEKLALSEIKDFCKSRGISHFSSVVVRVEISSSKVVLLSGAQHAYKILVIATGSPANTVCDQAYWQNILSNTRESRSDSQIILSSPSIAAYEVTSAIISLPQRPRLLVHSKGCARTFSSHPWLGSVSRLKRHVSLADTYLIDLPKAERSGISPSLFEPRIRLLKEEDPGLNKDDFIRASIYPIGTYLALHAGLKGSAQFSSFTAKSAALRIWLMSLNFPWAKFIADLLSDYPFHSRGTMLFSGPNWAGIWLGSKSPIGRPPDFDGQLAAELRRFFYLSQMNLFYSSKPVPKVVIYAYITLVLIGHIPWLAKHYAALKFVGKRQRKSGQM